MNNKLSKIGSNSHFVYNLPLLSKCTNALTLKIKSIRSIIFLLKNLKTSKSHFALRSQNMNHWANDIIFTNILSSYRQDLCVMCIFRFWLPDILQKLYLLVTWKRLNTETTQHGNGSKIRGNPSKTGFF